jgi:enterochelin esterase-like enzyme
MTRPVHTPPGASRPFRAAALFCACIAAASFSRAQTTPAPAAAKAPAAAPAAVSPKPLPIVVSPEVASDGSVTFRIYAPNARAVTVNGIRHLPDQPMAKDDSGLWSATVGPLAPDVYSYVFSIDGAIVTDPHDRDIKKYFQCESLFEVPGKPPILAAMQPVPHGVVHHEYYASKARKAEAGVEVYTPPGYDPRAATLYPVVYLLHGFGDREEAWLDAGHANWIADNLIVQGLIPPMIIVMPYGHAVPVEERQGMKDYSERNEAAMEKDMTGVLMPLIEREYRVNPAEKARAIAGLSMGGGQSIAIGLGHPGLFGSVGAFSAAAPEKDLDKTFAAIVKDPSLRPGLLWIGVGREDGLLKRNEAFHEWLDQKGIRHTWVLSEGGHEWPVWRAYLPQFLELAFR